MSALTRLRKIFPVLTPPDVKAEARVAIAQDVIDTLRIGRMNARKGSYFLLDDIGALGVDDSVEGVALATKRKGRTHCTVCAIGAAALCAAGLYDNAPELEEEWTDFDKWGNPHGRYVSSSSMKEVLRRWFSWKQLDIIECAFEQSVRFNDGGSGDRMREKAKQFGYRYDSSPERLEAIMQNIVDNSGTFKP